jgi:hypothetical protein
MSYFSQMQIVKFISLCNQLLVEPLLIHTGLISANQQNGGPIGIKGEGDPQDHIFGVGP